MYKQHLTDCIGKEIKICKRLYTKIPQDQMHFTPKEGMRTILELLQYLSMIGIATLDYWIQQQEKPFGQYFGEKTAVSKQLTPEMFLAAMDEQMNDIHEVFSKISEEDLYQKEITYPWGAKGPLGEGIINTTIKFLAAYKLQLFISIKLCSDQQLGTADAWVLTDLA
jgi:hypothetical protein